MAKAKTKWLSDSSHKSLKAAISTTKKALSAMRLAYRKRRYEPIPYATDLLTDAGKALKGYTFYSKRK